MDFNDNDNLKKILKGSYTAEIDRECMESGIDSGWLMNNAGTCVSDFILDCYRKKEFVFGSGQNAVGKTGRVKTCKSKSVLKLKGCILCGTGNNGGDGFVCALNLLKKGMDLTLFCSGFQEKLKGDSLFYYRKLLEIKEKPDPRTCLLYTSRCV